MAVAKNLRNFSGERPYTKSARVTSATPVKVVTGISGERNVVSFRFVNTQEPVAMLLGEMSDPVFKPMVWFVHKDETLGIEHQFYPEGMTVQAGKAFVEPGTPDSPLYSMGYLVEMYVAAIEGEGNIFYTISEDCR